MTEPLAHLERQFAAWNARLAQMDEVLAREAEILSQRDATALESIAEDKLVLMGELDELQNRTFELLGIQAGDSVDLAAWLAARAASAEITPRLLEAWAAIGERGRSCARRNEQNGAYVSLLSRHVTSSLEILRGPGSESTYGRDGARRGGGESLRSFTA